LPSWRFVLSVMLTMVFLVLGVGAAAWQLIEVPPESARAQEQTTTVYFAPTDASTDHGAEMGVFPGVKREIIDTTTLPEHVGRAVVASEDQSFFDNQGVDFRGIARALTNNLSGGARQGASTLTQQYVKNYYQGTNTGYLAKAQEAILALKINQQLGKDEILGRYLNTVYFGRGTDGIQAAAQAYFGKDAVDLTVSEAALLAGILPSPNKWDPARDRAKAEQRWSRTLNNMVELGWLSSTERAGLEFPETIPVETASVYGGPNGYLMELARTEAATKLGITEERLQRGGYTIVTTIDQTIQDEAVAAAKRLIDGELSGGATPSPDLKIAMVSLDPTTGAILSLYSGQEFLTDQINRVTRDRIQAGSTYKPFTLVAALENDISLNTTYNGANGQNIPGWTRGDGRPVRVNNFGNENFGVIDLTYATAVSSNTVYAQLNVEVGPQATADVAEKAGITTPQTVVPSNVLGTDTVRPLDMTAAYAVFANGGMRVEPHIVATVLNPDGSVAFTGGSNPVRKFSADVMADTVFALRGPVDNPRGSANRYVAPLKRTIAGKTGTSNDNKSAWFIGFTPDIVTTVVLSQVGENGRDQVSITPWGSGVRQITGGTWPSALWASYMKPVLAMPAYSENKSFPPRANVGNAPTIAPTEAEEPEEVETVHVPDGLAQRLEADASAMLLAAGLSPSVISEPSATVAAGRVIRVEPGSGTAVNLGSEVTLVVSSGPPPQPPGPGEGGGPQGAPGQGQGQGQGQGGP